MNILHFVDMILASQRNELEKKKYEIVYEALKKIGYATDQEIVNIIYNGRLEFIEKPAYTDVVLDRYKVNERVLATFYPITMTESNGTDGVRKIIAEFKYTSI